MTAAVPPAASIADWLPVTATWHFGTSDGLTDVVGTEASGRVVVMRGDGAGTLTPDLSVVAPAFPSVSLSS